MRRLATYGQATYGQAIQREATETDLVLGLGLGARLRQNWPFLEGGLDEGRGQWQGQDAGQFYMHPPCHEGKNEREKKVLFCCCTEHVACYDCVC